MVYCPVDERRMDEWALGGYSDFRHNQKTYDFFLEYKDQESCPHLPTKQSANSLQSQNMQGFCGAWSPRMIPRQTSGLPCITGIQETGSHCPW
jgi:hypothetical protein